MPDALLDVGRLSETQFAALVDQVKGDPKRRTLLTDLLREDHPVYDERSANETVRIRGWVLLAFEQLGLPDSALLFALEELDNGRDAYLVAAAARALRSYATPTSAFTPLLMRAISNIRYHDDTVCLERYGGYAVSEPGTTALGEVLATLRWLGANAATALPELEAMRANKDDELSAHLIEEVARTVAAIKRARTVEEPTGGHCCGMPNDLGSFRPRTAESGGEADRIDSTVFEDQDGNRISFGEFFRGKPSIAAFFYTRCNNPLKCSLTVTKLARVQQLLREMGLTTRIRTAAITYDPAYDVPARLRGYGQSRGIWADVGHRLLRSIDGMDTLCAHFQLGVNFVESLVNRHRIEVYVLDTAGRIAASFERLRWDERELVHHAATLLRDDVAEGPSPSTALTACRKGCSDAKA